MEKKENNSTIIICFTMRKHRELEPKRTPEASKKTIQVILEAIDIYWDLLFEHENTHAVVSEFNDDSGIEKRVHTVIQRIFDTSYYFRCEIVKRAEKKHPKSQLTYGEVLETIELRLLPIDLDLGMINIKHISPDGEVHSAQISIGAIPEKDPTVDIFLEGLQTALLSFLAGRCIGRELFDPVPIEVKKLWVKAYGEELTDEVWRTEVSR